MGLVLQFSVCQSNNCKQITFNETTQAYDPVANVNGWGTPNPAIASATVATLTVLIPNGQTYTFDLFNGLTPNWPTLSPSQNFILLSNNLGYGINNKLGDGIYTFTYSVTVSGVVYTQVKNVLLFCNSKCCVQNLYADVAESNSCVSCAKNKKDIADLARILLAGIEAAADCGQINTFNSLMTSLNRICANTNCCC